MHCAIAIRGVSPGTWTASDSYLTAPNPQLLETADTVVGFCDTIKDQSSPQNGNNKVIQAERASP